MFTSREDAGIRLAYRLQEFINGDFKGFVLATTRGGVVVGHVIAQHLKVPMAYVAVRNINLPGHPEVSMGAVDREGYYTVNPEIAPFINPLYFQAERLKNIRLADNDTLTVGASTLPYDFNNRDVIVVDDGAQPVTSLLATFDLLESQSVGNIMLALPLANESDLPFLDQRVDMLVVDTVPALVGSIHDWYQQFPWENDQKVKEILSHYSMVNAAIKV